MQGYTEIKRTSHSNSTWYQSHWCLLRLVYEYFSLAAIRLSFFQKKVEFYPFLKLFVTKLCSWQSCKKMHTTTGPSRCQKQHQTHLLREVGMTGYKPTKLLIDSNHNLQTRVGSRLIKRYHKLVGRPIFLYHARPVIAYLASLVIQLMQVPEILICKASFTFCNVWSLLQGKMFVFLQRL